VIRPEQQPWRGEHTRVLAVGMRDREAAAARSARGLSSTPLGTSWAEAIGCPRKCPCGATRCQRLIFPPHPLVVNDPDRG
jgi:hypothetical protein